MNKMQGHENFGETKCDMAHVSSGRKCGFVRECHGKHEILYFHGHKNIE